MAKVIVYEEQKGGNLAFMLSWTTLDGRPQIKYYDTIEEATDHFAHIKSLGRGASIFHKVKSWVEEEQK